MTTHLTPRRRFTAAALTLFGVVSCQDLDVANENSPDVERALSEPTAVQQIIVSAFHIWYNRLNSNVSTAQDVWGYYPAIADEMTRTTRVRQIQPGAEPRVALRNDALVPEVWIPRAPWDAFSSALANTNDGLRRIVDGMRIETLDPGAAVVTDNTDRAWVMGKLLQGLALGYLALTIDRAPPATEAIRLPRGLDALLDWERENLRPYPEVMAVAVRSLEQAIDAANDAEPFRLPTTWINGQTYASSDLVQLAHTLIARFLVYNARSPEERAALDWQNVLAHTELGLTFDFGPTLESGVIDSNGYLERLTNRTSTQQFRADVRLVGPADVSGAYQKWLAVPVGERDRIDIVTPDRRITGPTPASDGAYFRYMNDDTGFDPDRGRYNFSAYQWWRRENELDATSTSGHFVLISADENRLLRAEALLRTGDRERAADLINVTRTRSVRVGTDEYPGLPPVTAAGVPISPDCVPRTDTGACGSLMDALRYERQIELAGSDPMRAWFDYRGFGQLVSGTILHMPIPARYLASIGLPTYTFGGVGGEGAAP